jgi:predicted phosphoribosyltransferase
MKAAIQAIREREPERIVVGVPVGPPSTCQELEELADDVVCVATPAPLRGIGAWYEDFHQTDDDEVKACLARARDRA